MGAHFSTLSKSRVHDAVAYSRHCADHEFPSSPFLRDWLSHIPWKGSLALRPVEPSCRGSTSLQANSLIIPHIVLAQKRSLQQQSPISLLLPHFEPFDVPTATCLHKSHPSSLVSL